MARLSRHPDEIDSVRQTILDAALEIILEEGFQNLSMRKIGRHTGMTAPNIYNYFSGKDEINLEILRYGFEELYRRCEKARGRADDPFHGLELIIRAYMNFSLEKPNYFDLMWNRPTPKYNDYVGTEYESLAFREKQSALKVMSLFIDAVMKAAPDLSYDEARARFFDLWTRGHGVLALYVNRLLIEVDDDPGAIIEQTIRSIMDDLDRFLNKPETVTPY